MGSTQSLNAQQAITVINGRAVLAEYFQHNEAHRTLAGPLLPPLKHDNGARRFVRILHAPCQKADQVFEFFLLRRQMTSRICRPSRRVSAIPSRVRSQAAPQIELVALVFVV